MNPAKAWDYYQKRLHGPELAEPPIPGQSADAGDCSENMAATLKGKRDRRALLLEEGCPDDRNASSRDGRVLPDPVDIPKELQLLTADELIVVHPTTKKFHRVDPQFPGGRTQCGHWRFVYTSVEPQRVKDMDPLENSGCVSCGDCLGVKDTPFGLCVRR